MAGPCEAWPSPTRWEWCGFALVWTLHLLPINLSLLQPGMDKVRERGAPLPGNDKENWGNRHTGIWRKREEGGRRRRRGRKEQEEKRKKRRKDKKEEAEIEEFIEEKNGDHGDDKLKLSKANEWGNLGWNWNRNKEECEEQKTEENWRIGEEIARSEMGEKREEGWKATTRGKEGNVKEYWGNHDNGVIGIWRRWEEWGRRKRNEKEGKWERGRNSGIGWAANDKLKWSQANEWGKLNWNN